VINNQEASYAQYKQMNLTDPIQLMVVSQFQYPPMMCILEANCIIC